MELIEAFNAQEVDHFAKIQYVNRLAEDIEMYRSQCTKLREEIGKMKLRNDAVDAQKSQRTKALKARREVSNEKEAQLVAKTSEIQQTIAALKPALMALHVRIGCKENQDEKSLRGILGEIEHKTIDILHTMHAKASRKFGATDVSQVTSLIHSMSTLTPPTSEPSILGKTDQPYRYNGVRPPTLTLTEMHRKEMAEEEYPLTYDELKAKVWRGKDVDSKLT
ncbi:E3 ubiquitin-protein ligase mib1 [Aphanomyces cochlioides]|nr:E3 ubiquitin-protein ligase mib1 [Aphanomyces cochlioides]